MNTTNTLLDALRSFEGKGAILNDGANTWDAETLIDSYRDAEAMDDENDCSSGVTLATEAVWDDSTVEVWDEDKHDNRTILWVEDEQQV